MKKIYPRLSIFVCCLFLFGCGGGSSSNNDNSNVGDDVKIGYFIDSPVEGLTYITESQTGRTNSKGEFKYQNKEIITFRIGELVLGSTYAAQTLTPLDLTNSFSVTDKPASNIARLLQSLDENNDPSNGIKLPLAASNISSTIDLNDIASIEAGLANLDSQLSLKDAKSAEQHMQDSLDDIPSQAVVGSYKSIAAGNSNNFGQYADENLSCIYSNARINVKKDSTGLHLYDIILTRNDGGEELIQVDEAVNKYTISDKNVRFSWSLKDYYGRIILYQSFPEFSSSPQPPSCRLEVRLTTNDSVNLPPIVSEPFGTERFCTGRPTDTYDLGWGFSAYDGDGYVVSGPTVTFTVNGASSTLSSAKTSVGCYGATIIPSIGDWTPSSPGSAVCINDEALIGIPCTQGYSWRAEVIDNEGLVGFAEGSVPAPFEPEESSNELLMCSENYPRDACDDLVDLYDRIPGATTATYTAGSCSALVPDAVSIFQASDGAPSDYSGGDYISIFPADTDTVSCLTTIHGGDIDDLPTSGGIFDPDAGSNTGLPLNDLVGVWKSSTPVVGPQGQNATYSYFDISSDGSAVTYQEPLETGYNCTKYSIDVAKYFSGSNVSIINSSSFSVIYSDTAGETITMIYESSQSTPTGCEDITN